MLEDDRYWSVDILGLTESEAHQLLQWVEAHSVGWHGKGSALAAESWLTLHLDRDSAQMIYDGLMSNPATATPEYGLAAEFGSWLSATPDDN